MLDRIFTLQKISQKLYRETTECVIILLGNRKVLKNGDMRFHTQRRTEISGVWRM